MSVKLKWREAATLIIISRSFIRSNRLANHNNNTHYADDGKDCDFKVLTVMRTKRPSFMPGGYVFPGGAIHASDASRDWLTLYKKFGYSQENLPSITAANACGSVFENDGGEVSKVLSLRITAIRETFEECGILLCKNTLFRGEKPSNWGSFLAGHEIQEWQKRIIDNPYEFINLCKHFDCYPDVWSLQIWSNWLTPTDHPKRFDTAFFITSIDQIPPVWIDNSEIIGFKWDTPSKLLNMCNNKDIWLPPPQYYELSRLKNFQSIEKLVDFTASRNGLKFERWMPVRSNLAPGQITFSLPGDCMYPSNPIYENDEDFQTESLDESPTDNQCEGKPMHRMETNGFDYTRLVMKNMKSDGLNVLPWMAPEDKTKPPSKL